MGEALSHATYDAVVDSGVRENFETGSRRDSRTGKGRFDLIPAYPLKRLAQHYENGAVKYGDRNWELGQPLSRYLDSAERHINAYKDGDRKEDHLTAVVWNIFSLIWTEEQVRRGNLSKDLADLDAHLLHLGGQE